MQRPLTAKISAVEVDGSFYIMFSDEILLLQKDSVVAKNAVSIKVFWMNDAIRSGKTDEPSYTVQLISLDSRSINFKLNFVDPSLVSRGITKDVVTVTFNGLNFFLRESDQAQLDPKSRVLFEQIPRQLEVPNAGLDAIRQLSVNARNAEGVALASMITGGFTSLPTASLWGAFNTIQLITMQAFTSHEMPSNAENLFRSLDEFMRGGSLNPGKFITGKLQRNEQPSVSPKRQL